MDGAEWNTAAVGPTQARACRRSDPAAARRASRRAACCTTGRASGIPGEPLPRWAFACYWRRDGEPLWQRPGADRRRDARLRPRRRSPTRERFCTALGERLGRRPATAPCRPTKTPCHFLLAERKLPANVDPLRQPARRPEERARLARVFERGLGRAGRLRAAAAALADAATAAALGERALDAARASKLFLVPGDSPLGFRLPLDSLPWIAADRLSARAAASTRSPRVPPLPDPQAR